MTILEELTSKEALMSYAFTAAFLLMFFIPARLKFWYGPLSEKERNRE